MKRSKSKEVVMGRGSYKNSRCNSQVQKIRLDLFLTKSRNSFASIAQSTRKWLGNCLSYTGFTEKEKEGKTKTPAGVLAYFQRKI